jgi:hypothetical protein
LFFDDFPRFTETSQTSSERSRLNLRHKAIIEANADVLRGARVLDIASHDGRWSFAALKAGASHVTAVEARQHLVDNAHATFAEYGVDPASRELVCADVFHQLRQHPVKVDVVLCLGFLYHTLRYSELLHGIRATGARHLVVDTMVTKSQNAVIGVISDRTRVEANAVADEYSTGSRALAGFPSLPALEEMLGAYGYKLEHQFDWAGNIPQGARGTVRDYAKGKRISVRFRRRRSLL